MVSKEEYYRRKEAGLCTKCGKTREGSPSKARCLDCHNKLKKKAEDPDNHQPTPTVVVDERLALEKLKRQALLSKPENAVKVCGICGEQIGSFNLFCQKCLKVTVFTREDAILRYGASCTSCKNSDIKQLKLVSSDIGVPMAKHGAELYKIVCYRRIKPAEYKVQCHECYWKDSIAYTRQLKTLFYQGGYFFPDEPEDESEEDIIDIS